MVRKKQNTVVYGIVAVFIIAFLFGVVFTFSLSQTRIVTVEVPVVSAIDGMRTATIQVPAVDQDNNGVLANITVRAVPGKGNVLTNIDRILFWIDTQNSILTARDVAIEYSGRDVRGVDLIYDIDASAQVIEGPSAGAALTIATIAVLEDKEIDPRIMVTGTIRPDRRIGRVGGVREKAIAAEKAGGRLFIAPKGTATTITGYEKQEVCESTDGFEFCRTNYRSQKKNIGEEIGITIIEVETIEDVTHIYFGENA